ncbi:MAG: fibronectin type III domain-containing protein, partial [Clostridia bacterium]|nr:fibronectin type III domain-containing protein [Clostridia bacterium]
MVKRKVLLVIALLVFTLVCLTGCNFLEKLGIGKKTQPSNEPVTLSAPTLSISGTTLSWTRIEHADEYRVRYVSEGNTVYRTVTTTSATVPDLEVGRYAVSVMARSASSGYLDSEYSNQVNYIKSAALTMGEVELFVIDNTYLQVSWSPVDHVSGYEIKVDGGESHRLGSTAVSYQLDLPEEEATVKVRALGDGTLYLDSEWSQAEFDPSTVTPAVELDFDLADGELCLAVVATEAKLDQRAFPFEVRGGNT